MTTVHASYSIDFWTKRYVIDKDGEGGFVDMQHDQKDKVSEFDNHDSDDSKSVVDLDS